MTQPITPQAATTDGEANLADQLIASPESYVDHSYHAIFSMEADARERFWLEAARRRFAELRPKIAMLDTLATKQGLDAINSLDDPEAMPPT